MNIQLRLETPTDHRAVEELTREAFWGFTEPACNEHYLVHILRSRSSFMPELNYVAEVEGQLAGNVMYSKAKIVAGDGGETEVLTFGPLSVLPVYWNKGVGSALMRRSVAEAKRLGYMAIVFYGHPDYYPRFGFRSAAAFGITNPDGKNFDALMAMALYDGALDGVSGVFYEDEAFNINAAAAEEYNRNFPHKEPTNMIPIDGLLDRLKPPARKAFTDREITTLAWLNRLSGREMLQWDGIDYQAIEIINKTLKEYGYSPKLLPSSYILQLAQMGVIIPIVAKIREKDGISVYRVDSNGERYILKSFENPWDRREISNYKLLAALNVPTLPMLNHTEMALLLPDVEACGEYRLGTEADMSDVRVARAVARWYKTLHEKGTEANLKSSLQITVPDGDLYDETDVVTLENMDYITVKTDTRDNPLWTIIREQFDQLRRKIDALPRTLTYNDFYWTNLIVAKDGKMAMMLDFNLLGRGYAYGDVRNVTSSLTDEAKQAFLDEYGTEYIYDVETAADAVLSPLVTLCIACRRENFPSWAEPSLNELKNGVLFDNLRRWLCQ